MVAAAFEANRWKQEEALPTQNIGEKHNHDKQTQNKGQWIGSTKIELIPTYWGCFKAFYEDH